MNCQQVSELVSAYLDRQLTDDLQAAVADHLQTCADCCGRVERLRRLSDWVAGIDAPRAPSQIWAEIETKLKADRRPGRRVRRAWHRTPAAGWALGLAGLLLLVASVIVGYPRWQHWRAEQQLAGAFQRYVQLFPTDPHRARQILTRGYTAVGKLTDLRPADLPSTEFAPAGQLAAAFQVRSATLWKMPCCDCLEVVCRRKDGSQVAVFRHDQAEPGWLKGCRRVAGKCDGRTCHIVQAASQLAATWSVGSHHYTIVGARNLDEVKQLVRLLDHSGPGASTKAS